MTTKAQQIESRNIILGKMLPYIRKKIGHSEFLLDVARPDTEHKSNLYMNNIEDTSCVPRAILVDSVIVDILCDSLLTEVNDCLQGQERR